MVYTLFVNIEVVELTACSNSVGRSKKAYTGPRLPRFRFSSCNAGRVFSQLYCGLPIGITIGGLTTRVSSSFHSAQPRARERRFFPFSSPRTSGTFLDSQRICRSTGRYFRYRGTVEVQGARGGRRGEDLKVLYNNNYNLRENTRRVLSTEKNATLASWSDAAVGILPTAPATSPRSPRHAHVR